MVKQQKKSGCGTWLLVVFALGMISWIGTGIAKGCVVAVEWIRYGPSGLPAGVAVRSLYPYAWAFFFCVLGVLGVAIGVAIHEVSVRDRYRRYLAAEETAQGKRVAARRRGNAAS